MKLYVKAISSFSGDIDAKALKGELKTKYSLDTRRQDSFIHLAVYGAQLLKDKTEISPLDELFITSGVGNIDVLQRTNKYVCEEKDFIKPFDFINMLGNTTSYYVSVSLGLRDKNIFEISNRFTYINTLISVFTSLNSSKKDAILGAIDLATNPKEVIKRVLGVDEEVDVTSSVNYQKLSLKSKDAIGEIEFDMKFYTYDEILSVVEDAQCEVITSMRCTKLKNNNTGAYFETIPSSFVNQALQNKTDIIYIDCFEERYKFVKVSAFR